MSCSARLPVYAVLIAACVPDTKLGGVFGLQGLTLLAMYLLGTVMALGMAWVFKKTLLKGETPMLIMELPPYKRPVATTILRHMWDRSKLFLRRAGTVILGINIVLWFLATYPKNLAAEQRLTTEKLKLVAKALPSVTSLEEAERILTWHKTMLSKSHPMFGVTALPQKEAEAMLEQVAELENQVQGEKLRHSFAGRLGHLIEPAIAPLGFDWKMGIGIVASFAAREVFVSTMSVVYNVGEADDSDAGVASLAQVLQNEKRDDGKPTYTPLVGVTLMVYYVFALQCVSTIAVVRRETNAWKWPLFQLLYMTALAWAMAFLTYQGGKLLGWG
jgi:ferrous iron transport protein B